MHRALKQGCTERKNSKAKICYYCAMKKNAFYAQSGGVTSVINATACGVIEGARKNRQHINTVFAGQNGILGALQENLIDTRKESPRTIAGLRYLPGGAFGSCRYRLQKETEYQRLAAVFDAHHIGYFFYNGGGDSQDTTHKVAQYFKKVGFPITCIGIPKTIDNDLPLTDNCPGFGSVAKYVATSVREAGLDVESMYVSSTKVFILEVMGRHSGWIAASAGLAAEQPGDPPHIILFPEIPFDKAKVFQHISDTVGQYGYCVIVASEGLRDKSGTFLTDSANKDAFGHVQLGGVAPILSQYIQKKLGYKCHWAVADYLQRSARHIASRTDVEQAYAMGEYAVQMALKGQHGQMPIIRRIKGTNYRWKIDAVPIGKVANVERTLPKSYITRNGTGITASAKTYLAPLIKGEDFPPFKNGLPHYVRLKKVTVAKKLPAWDK